MHIIRSWKELKSLAKMSYALLASDFAAHVLDTSYQVRYAEPDNQDVYASIAKEGVKVPLEIAYPDKPDASTVPLIAGYNRLRYLLRVNEEREKSGIDPFPVPIHVSDVPASKPARIIASGIRDNVERNDMNVMDRAHAIRRGIEAGMSNKALAESLHISEGRVSQLNALNDLPKVLKVAIANGVPETVSRLKIVIDGKETPLATMDPEAINRVLVMAQDEAVKRARATEKSANLKDVLDAVRPRTSEVEEALAQFWKQTLEVAKVETTAEAKKNAEAAAKSDETTAKGADVPTGDTKDDNGQTAGDVQTENSGVTSTPATDAKAGTSAAKPTYPEIVQWFEGVASGEPKDVTTGNVISPLGIYCRLMVAWLNAAKPTMIGADSGFALDRAPTVSETKHALRLVEAFVPVKPAPTTEEMIAEADRLKAEAARDETTAKVKASPKVAKGRKVA